MKIIISDFKGTLIKILIIGIAWYSQVLQYKYFQVPQLLLIMGVLLFLLVGSDYLSRRDRLILPLASKMILLFSILSFFVGMINSPDLSTHINNGFSVIEYSLILVSIVYFAVTRKDIDFLVWNIALIACFTCAVFLINPEIARDVGGVVRYSFSETMNPNMFTFYLATGAWALLYLVMSKKIPFIVGFGTSVVMLYACFSCGSKGGLLNLLLCLVLWMVLCYIPLNEKKSDTKKILRSVLSIVIIFVAIRILMPYYGESSLAARISNLNIDASTLTRMDMYTKGIEYVKMAPLTGIGFRGFTHFYGSYSHSTIIETVVSAGIPLALFYFSSYINMWLHIFRLRRQNKTLGYKTNYRVMQAIILFCMLMLYCLFGIHFYELNTFYYFGVLISLYTIEEQKLNETSINE